MEQNRNQNSPQQFGSTLQSSSTSDAYVQEKINQIFEQTAFRKKTNEIIEEYVDTVPFMKKVQLYADEQIDRRLFKNTKVVIAVILGWVVTAAIAFAAAWLGK
jgi:hypothetical protein